MTPELSDILGKAERGTRFRLRSLPNVIYEVSETEVAEIKNGEGEQIVGYRVEGGGYIGGGVKVEQEDVKILDKK